MAVLVMCCAIVALISTTVDALEGQRRGGEQNFNGVSADGAETGELKQSLMQLNATPTSRTLKNG